MGSNYNQKHKYILIDENRRVVNTFRARSNALDHQKKNSKYYVKLDLVNWENCTEDIKVQLKMEEVEK